MIAATLNPSSYPANLAHRAGFSRDLFTVARRSLRGALREPEAVIPALIIPVFFFAVNVGSLQKVAEAAGGFDYKAWGVAFTGFPYSIALRTGNPGAVTASFILFSRSHSSPPPTCPRRR